MNNIEIKHLRMLCAIAATGNMTRAADDLCLSQSAISQQLKDIEAKLGAELFYRARKKMILTPAGKTLFDTARQVTRLVEDSERHIAGMVSGERGELKVGVQCLFCYKWLPQAVRTFQKTFPNVELVIGTAYDLAEDLEKRKFDMIVSAAPVTDGRFQYVPLFGDQMVCVMPAAHPLIERDFIRIEDLKRFNLIAHAERSRNRFYQVMMRPREIEPKRYLTVDQPQAMLEMVVAGLGIGLFPAWAVREAAASGRVATRPLTAQGLPLRWHAVSLPSGNIPVFQEEFVRIVSRLNISEEAVNLETVADPV